MQRINLDATYERLSNHIYNKNKDYFQKQQNPEINLNNTLQLIFHRFLILELIARTTPRLIEDEATKGKSNNWIKLRILFDQLEDIYPNSLFGKQQADQLIVEEAIIEKVRLSLANFTIDEIIYAHEKIMNQNYLINHDGNLVNNIQKRKKGGVYYTPAFIVDYIVENTLGTKIAQWEQIIDRAVPEDLPVLMEQFKKFKILDPSCGSGVFLVTAARRLISLYNLYNQKIKSSHRRAQKIDSPGLFLSTYNLFGVDIDERALEFTVFNMMSVLSAGNQQINQQIYLSLKKALTWADFLKAHDNKKVIYDIIIGNPPYISHRGIDQTVKKYIREKYNWISGQYDLIIPFLEGSLRMLRLGGKVGFILPNKYLATDYGYLARKNLIKNYTLEQIVDASSSKVFGDASVYPVIQVIKKEKPGHNKVLLLDLPGGKTKNMNNMITKATIPQSFYRQGNFIISTELNSSNFPILNKMFGSKLRIPENLILCGIATSGFSKQIINSKQYDNLTKSKQAGYKRLIQVSNINQYKIDHRKNYIHREISSLNHWQTYNGPKLVIPGMAKKISAAIDRNDCALGRVYYIREDAFQWNIYFLLGLFNSAIIQFFYHSYYWPVHLSGGYLRFNSTYLSQIPIPAATEDMSDKIAKLAGEMEMIIHKGLTDDHLKANLDCLIGEMYGLNSKEIQYIINHQGG